MRIFRSYNNFAIVIFRNCFLPSHGGHNLPLCWRVCLWLPLHLGVSIRQSNDEYNYVMRDGNLIYLLLAPFILVRQILSLLAPSLNIRLVCRTSGPVAYLCLIIQASGWLSLLPVHQCQASARVPVTDICFSRSIFVLDFKDPLDREGIAATHFCDSAKMVHI